MENLQTLTLFGGLSAVAIVYWLVAHARRVKLITDQRAAFIAPGALWLAIVATWAVQQQPRPPAFMLLLIWLGGWVATLLFKAGVKDNERPPAPPA